MNDPAAILERSLHRDACIRAAGHDPGANAEIRILEFITTHGLYDEESARRWLIERASTENDWVARHVVDSIKPLIEGGHPTEAVDIFSSLVGLGNEKKGMQRRQRVFNTYSTLGYQLEQLIGTPGLIRSQPNAWGRALIQMESLLLREDQQQRFAQLGKVTELSREWEPNYDDRLYCRYYERRRPSSTAWETLAHAIEQGLEEAAGLSDGQPFRILADQLIESKWGLAICQPLVALYDYVKRHKQPSWQHDEAFRLLSVPGIEECGNARDWRRLLRRQLLPLLRNEDRNVLLDRIRESQNDEIVRINELADFQGYALLTVEEENKVRKTRDEDGLFEPFDSRELRRGPASSTFPREPPKDHRIATWPRPEDRDSLGVLVSATALGDTTPIDEIERSLYPRLDALTMIVTRPEIDSSEWIGHILAWCTDAIADLKRWHRIEHHVPRDTEIGVDEFIQLLANKAPWWERRVVAAIGRLRQAPPASHASHDSDRIYWNSSDPIACSLGYLDEILAVSHGSRLDAYRSSFADAICQAWDNWPRYTRGLAISIVRTYHWATSEKLQERLVSVLESESHSSDIEFSLRHLLKLGQSGVADLIRQVINRIDTLSAPSDVTHLAGVTIGNAVARYRGDGEHDHELEKLSRLYDEMIENHSYGPTTRHCLVASAVRGVKWHLGSRSQLQPTHAEAWLSVVIGALTDWLETGPGRCDDLPVLPISDMQDISWSRDQRLFLLKGMARILLRIIEEADLGAFYEIHYDLRKLFREDQPGHNIVLDRSARLALDQDLVAFCQASAKRVEQWQAEGRTTNDVAYIHGLRGGSTAELIDSVFATAADRDNARRELAPVIDILADAGLYSLSSQLRQRLRSS